MAQAPKTNPKKTLTDADRAKRDKEHAEAFVKLVNKRVSKSLQAHTILKRLANPRNYKFNEDQVNKIEDALSNSVASTIKAFREALKGGGTAAGAPSFDVTK